MVSYATTATIEPATNSVLLVSTKTRSVSRSDKKVAKPGCRDRCGNVSIPYPFGMDTSDCYYDSGFKITCNHSTGTPVAFLDSWLHRRYEVLQITLDHVRVRVSAPSVCGHLDFSNETRSSEPFLHATPFTINLYGCATDCAEYSYRHNHCNTTIPRGLKGNLIRTNGFGKRNNISGFYDPCIRVFLVDQEFPWFDKPYEYFVPVILDWAMIFLRRTHRACLWKKTYCLAFHNGPGYTCKCSKGYEGNPYLLNGCQGIGLSIVLLVLLGMRYRYQLRKRFEKRKQMKLKKSHFTRNGGLLLKQKIASNDGKVEKEAKIFITEELETITDDFNPSRIIRRGGFGTVYKGMLSDGEIVAIKKSTLVDETQVDQFIKEVLILSQTNNRHIVKLLGCCLETEVPLLVYEFVPNETLAYHLHLEEGDFESTISWKDRVRIASEVAGALEYLHSDAAMPIFHRDIKSTNILLNEKLQAKVSDFGISRSIPIEKTHLTTLVQGSFGYLDPEYFHSSQFTDKSDIYSFRIVLVELLTGEKAISQIRNEEEKGLALYFIKSMKEHRLPETLDGRVLNEAEIDDVLVVAKLAKRCLKYVGKKRPTMKEVSLSLGGLHEKLSKDPLTEE
ncbi:hypothetical protein MKX01_004367 [Papaver californicum]|nr:hypothetical protein MKX01_004367 [Papaver californicum]